MATGNIRGGKRNYAEPSSVVISAVASTTAAQATVSISKGSRGPQALTYTVSATSATTNAVIPSAQTVTADSAGAASATFTSLSSSQVYQFIAYGTNYNGSGTADTTTSNGVTAAAIYTASTSYVTAVTTTVTIPTFATKMAALVIGAGGGGGNGYTNNNGYPYPAPGGGGGGATVFKDLTVTGGTTIGIVIGAGGNASGSVGGTTTLTYGGSVRATANGGNAGNASNNAQVAGNGGTASSNVAGATNASGGGGGGVGGTGGNATQLVPYSLTNTNITAGHGGGGGGGVDYYENSRAGGTAGGGTGGRGDNNYAPPSAGGDGSGGGGGGAGSYSENYSPGTGRAGGTGGVYLYFL